ncbi:MULTISPECIES: hypothetical protein [unclassified Desulfovibrio]|uniref:hypothetical protein n=1 Tax=unclassified Desulfovibrio TaxID=2593640 RepID=UPI001639BB8F|nr:MULTISPECIES: hypothetical protein [unclassified Desulfovibrio]
MPEIDADGFRFDFPDSWKVAKYDDWSFYRNQFGTMDNGIKAVDIVALDEKKTLWLIEVKNFQKHGRRCTVPLHEEVWKKVYDTLAGLFSAKCNAVDAEQRFAQAVAKACKIRVVLHMEQPPPSSRLYHESLDSANICHQLRKKMKPVDPHPQVANKESPHVPWSVLPLPCPKGQEHS